VAASCNCCEHGVEACFSVNLVAEQVDRLAEGTTQRREGLIRVVDEVSGL
jgi:hypothetical protein